MKRLVSLIACVVLSTGLLVGCVSQSSNDPLTQKLSFDKEKIDAGVVNSNSGFALEIFKKLNNEDKKENIFISPLSISAALTMAYQGSGSTTRDTMAKALGYEGLAIEQINESYKNLIRYLVQVDKKVQLNISNSIWIRDGETVREDFLSLNKDVFNARAEALDFSKESSVNEINNWISNSTKGKIQKVIDSPIPDDTIMYLINAIYFKGQWTEQFDKKKTFSSKFQTDDGSKQEVMMMNRKGDIEYGQGEDFKVVRLPYGSGKTSMYCILPGEDTSINDFIEGMDINKWKTIKESVSKTEDVILQLPRFKTEYGIKNLKDSLTALGMGEAFSEQADFSGISEDVSISRVLHKAVIEVNEEGSEAAGVTVVEMNKLAVMDPITFIGDRPFIFLITDDETGSILFMGKLYDVG